MEDETKEVSPVAPKYSEHHEAKLKASLEEKEGVGDNLPPFCLTFTELKLLGIAGVGFFLDGEHRFPIVHKMSIKLDYSL
jgi:MFS transporter, PHS family, inorganic phosphate transporter